MYLRDLKNFLIKLKINLVEKIKEFFEFNTYIQTLKIIHETSPPYSRASNGVVEGGK